MSKKPRNIAKSLPSHNYGSENRTSRKKDALHEAYSTFMIRQSISFAKTKNVLPAGPYSLPYRFKIQIRNGKYENKSFKNPYCI